MPRLFHHLLTHSAKRFPEKPALLFKEQSLNYLQLLEQAQLLAEHLQKQLKPNARVGIYLPKQFETVISFFAVSMSGAIFVPINPLLKAEQVAYIMQDCEVEILITSFSRYQQLQNQLASVASLKQAVLTQAGDKSLPADTCRWDDLVKASPKPISDQAISKDIAAILYTSGSTGKPKGVVLSHNNLIAGARSVSEYLNNHDSDRILAVLPFSFDYGLSQITTAFLVGASVVLLEYLLPKDVLRAIVRYQITGLAAVPPLWVQLSQLSWPAEAQTSLRYITNSGGAMPLAILKALQSQLPSTQIFLMYGLTEAFRSTYLPPSQVDIRPSSIGKAIPDAEIMVINQQGQECASGEHGELVHRGPHVALGYWNAPDKSLARFKPLPQSIATGLTEEIAVWSGDTVYKDEEGYLYFVGRQDDMIKSSGYRISPSEVEDVVFQCQGVKEVSAIGVPHLQLGQAILLVLSVEAESFDLQLLTAHCQKQLPNFMQPKAIRLLEDLPRNPNGKINRKALAEQFQDVFSETL